MATRLLVIHRQLVFAVTIKQALEQTGGFAVHPFTKAEAAFDFLRDHPQDIALVDFNLPGRSGAKIIQQLRSLQPDIAIIVTPQLSADDQRSYGVQGSLNSPFSARDLLPLLQDALDEAPNENLRDSAPLSGGQMTTSNLGDQKRIKRQQMGTTQNLGSEAPENKNEPSQTHLLNTEENKPETRQLGELPSQPPQRPFVADSERPSGRPTTRPFTGEPDYSAPPPPQPTRKPVDPFKTRNFEDDFELNDLRPPKTEPLVSKEAPPPTMPEVDRFQTRNLQDQSPEPEEPNYGTHILPDIPTGSEEDSWQPYQSTDDEPDPYDDPVQTRNLDRQDPFGTRPLDGGGTTPLPPSPPEFSSLDRVLQSFAMEEPLADDMDTPAVPTKDSDALRQFMATSSSSEDAGFFDDVLGAIEPDLSEKPKQQRQVDFEGLVKSMQRNEPQSRLPDRQQQLMDFVLTSGMDSVLEEIEKTKTGKLPKLADQPPETRPLPRSTTPPPSISNANFEKLALEEPPLPTLEENGTVSDLLVGIADSNFRDVLALLNDPPGEPSAPTPPRMPKAATPPPLPAVQTDSQYLDDFLQSTDVDSDSVRTAPPPRPQADRTYDFNFDYDDDDDGATVAGVVLRSTTENTTMPGEFSLDQLMSDINDRLTSHKLKVKPLPSWDMDTTAFHAPVTDVPPPPAVPMSPSKRMPGEPSFLPEMFPVEEMIPPELPELEAEVAEVWTTRASEPSLETIEEVDANAETMVEMGYFDEPQVEEEIPEAPAAIDADMFSGIFDEATQYDDDTPRYDSEAESSSQQPIYGWGEPLVETDIDVTAAWQEPEIPDEATPQWITADVQPEAILPPEPSIAEDWDTLESVPTFDEPVADFTEYPTYEEPIAAETLESDWDTGWDVSQTIAEPPVEPISVAWDEPQAAAETPTISLTEEAKIAQLALNLTQVSLEVSAEGTILTRDNGIIAVAGHLSQDDVIELATTINNDWGTGGQGARLRFITLPSSGKEYMLYSTGTEDDLILSMIFAGSTPLRVIRQQGQRLVKALGEVPEPEIRLANPEVFAPKREVQPVEEALEPYAYVWLVQNPEQPLTSAVAQSISAGLTIQLSEMNWQIEQLQVRDEYIYLLANIPGEEPSYSVVRDLKQRAASIAQKQDSELINQDMWADSYLVLSPGRELAPDEIQEFIDFQRMM